MYLVSPGKSLFYWLVKSSINKYVALTISTYFISVALVLQGNSNENLPPKNKTDICTIMYTSGTTGEPKGVIISNGAFVAAVLSVDELLQLTDKVV